MKNIQISIYLGLTDINKYEGTIIITGEIPGHNKVYNFKTGNPEKPDNKILVYNDYDSFFIPSLSFYELSKNLSYYEFHVARVIKNPIYCAIQCINDNCGINASVTTSIRSNACLTQTKVEREFPPYQIEDRSYSHIYRE